MVHAPEDEPSHGVEVARIVATLTVTLLHCGQFNGDLDTNAAPECHVYAVW